jgi:hypothetical protein
VTSRDRISRVKHSTRILRSSHLVELGNLLNSRIKVGRVNSIGLKPNPTITLIFTTKEQSYQKNIIAYFRLVEIDKENALIDRLRNFI